MSSPHVSTPARETPRAPMQAWAARWPLAVVLGVLGALLGVAAAWATPTTYTAEARVAVGPGDLSAGAIAGFPQASEQLASNYARYVNDRALAGPTTGSSRASPIPESNVIRIESEATSRSDAVQQVQETTDDLVDSINSERESQDLFARFSAATTEWSTALARQSAAQSQLASLIGAAAGPQRLATAREELAAATAQVATSELVKDSLGGEYRTQQEAAQYISLRVVLQAEVVASDATALLQRNGLMGAVLGLALSLLVAVLLERRTTRGRRDTPADEPEVG